MNKSFSIILIIIALAMFIVGSFMILSDDQHAESVYHGATMVMGGNSFE